MQDYRHGEEVGRKKEKDYAGKESTVILYRKDRYVGSAGWTRSARSA